MKKDIVKIVNYNVYKNERKIIFETAKTDFKINIYEEKELVKSNVKKLAENLYVCSCGANAKDCEFEFKSTDDIINIDLHNSFNKVNLLNTKNYSFSKINISYLRLKGINKATLYLNGSVNIDGAKVFIMADEKLLNFDNKARTKNDFVIECNILGYHKITFGVEIAGERIKVIELKNNYLKRLILTMKIELVAFLTKCCKSIKAIGRGIRNIWKKYHFLIPPSLWGKYLKKLVSIIINPYTNFDFYDPNDIEQYNAWIKEKEKFTQVKEENLTYKPLISVIIPVYNVSRKYLTCCLDSILNQTYTNFEICLTDDASTNTETIETLKEYEKKDKRIKVNYRKENGHISNASNDSLKMAKGEFIALVDNDDTLDNHALMEFVNVLNEKKDIDFIYSDEDKLNLKGKRCYPHFKPDFSPDTLLSLNYICHLSVLRKSIVEKVGGFAVGLEGAQDHDLFLKVSEVTDKIYHIPKILYHWRMIPSSTSMGVKNKDYASDKGKIAIENALKRRKIKASVLKEKISTYYIVNYDLEDKPMVSIIIPTKDYASTLDVCLKSIYKKTTYPNFEVIVVNNNSEEKETFKLFNKYKSKYKNFRVIDANMEFNYSRINNLAIKEAQGEYIVLLNNDTELLTNNWLELMVGYASQKHIGAVGVKLLYPDDTIQHGGVVLGLGGVAGHAFVNLNNDDPTNTMFFGRLYVPYDYSAVTAACLLIEKKKYLEVGGLTEDLKVAFNDVDFCIKLLEKGYNNVFLPMVCLHHYESKSRGLDTSGEKLVRFNKEVKYMRDKWAFIIDNDKYYNKNLSKKNSFKLEVLK